jgi:hypothetical protein
MFDYIEHVIYINLEHRKDRRQHIEKTLTPFGERVQRLDAVYEPHRGHLGCSKSHALAMQIAIQSGWKNVLIVEDDAEWNKFEQGVSMLDKLCQKPFDVIMLGGTAIKYHTDTNKLIYCACSTAYLVNQHYYQTLLDIFNESIQMLEASYTPRIGGALDSVWGVAQARDNWYIIVPCLMSQLTNYSDTEYCVTMNANTIL